MLTRWSKMTPFVVIAFVFLLIFVSKKLYHQGNQSSSGLKIGILQTITHPALDRSRNGLMDYFKRQYTLENVEFIIQNGEGSISTLNSMAKGLQEKADVFFAIGTQAAQAIAQIERNRPIVFAAVSSATKAGLIYPKTNVSGITDGIDGEDQVKTLIEFFPQAKKVVLLYNPEEVNSIEQIRPIESELRKFKREVIHVGVSSEAELPQKMKVALSKGDIILVPTDNLIVSSMPYIASVAKKNKVPLIASDNPSVENGALMSEGVDYYEQGKFAAELLMEIISTGKSPEEFSIKVPENRTLLINRETFDALEISIPKSFKDRIKFFSNL